MKQEGKNEPERYFSEMHKDLGVRNDFLIEQILTHREEFETLALERSCATEYLKLCKNDMEEVKTLQVKISYMDRDLQWLNDHLAYLEQWWDMLQDEFDDLECMLCLELQDWALERTLEEDQAAQA